MYSEDVADVLKEKKISVGDRIEIKKEFRKYEGILMPRIDMGDRSALVLKLDNGYNIGLKLSKGTEISLVSKGPDEEKREEPEPARLDPTKPRISVLSMGGTISSKVDYRTGGVTPKFTAGDLVESVPELAEIANIRGREVESILSEDMRFSDYKKLASTIQKEIKEGCDGIIVTHGTDTMHYTACALAFVLDGLSTPVILVGSQRSSDRASSDGPMNLLCAAQFLAKTDFGEVGVCMHASENDDYCFIHPACKVRKMHTSRRDAFKPVNSLPWALVSSKGEIRFFMKGYRRKGGTELKTRPNFEDRVALLKSYPDMEPKIIDFYTKNGYKGLVLEGTGLGHIPSYLSESLGKFLKKGIVVMTSQCISGRVNMNVYSTGRELERLGVVQGGDMLPETAYIKLSWLIANYKDMEEVKRLMGENLRGEMSDKSI